MLKKKNPDTSKRSYRIKLIVIILFTFSLYANTINNGYSLDDEFVIHNNEKIHKGIKGIPEILSSFYFDDGEKKFGYRPITQVSYAIEYSIFGENPHLSHFINILLYIITGALLFYLLSKFLSKYNSWLPFIITLLFLAHPIHTEVVASIKNREEILSFLGSITALIFIHKFYIRKSLVNLIIGIISFILAYLSKESAIVFVAIIPLTIYFFSEFSFKKLLLIFLLLLFVGIALRYTISSRLPIEYSSLFFENPLNFSNKLILKLSTGMLVLGFYIKILIFPHPLLYYYGYNMIPVEGFNVLSIALLLIHLGIFVYAIFGLRKKKLISFAILYYLICISMFTNILLPINGIVGERLAYFASLGFVIALSILIMKVSKIPILENTKKPLTTFIIVLLIVLIPYSAKTITRNNDWFDHYTLYSNDIEYLENSAKANELIGNWLYEHINELKENEIQDAVKKIEKYYLQSLKVYPENTQVTNNLGSLYLTHLKKIDSAIVYFNRCLEVDSTYEKAHFNIAQCYQFVKNDSLAIKHYESVLEYDSMYVKAVANLSILYATHGKFNGAIKLNERLIRINPKSEVPYYNLANIHVLMGDTVKGLEFAEKSLAINPTNFQLALNVSEFFKKIDNIEKAKFYYNLAEKYKQAQKYKK